MRTDQLLVQVAGHRVIPGLRDAGVERDRTAGDAVSGEGAVERGEPGITARPVRTRGAGLRFELRMSVGVITDDPGLVAESQALDPATGEAEIVGLASDNRRPTIAAVRHADLGVAGADVDGHELRRRGRRDGVCRFVHCPS
jgi:hypothetical protein